MVVFIGESVSTGTTNQFIVFGFDWSNVPIAVFLLFPSVTLADDEPT